MWKRSLQLCYTSHHQWIELNTGYCGITRHIYDDLYPIKSLYVPMGTRSRFVKMNQLIGVLSVNDGLGRYNIMLPSVGTGHLIKVNSNWNAYKLDADWLYQITDLSEITSDLMEYDEYMSHLYSMH